MDRNGGTFKNSVSLDTPGYEIPQAAPVQNAPEGHDMEERTHESLSARTVRRASSVMHSEGPRGYSSRAAILVKYATYFLAIVFGVAGTSAAFGSIPGVSAGGKWLLISVTAQMIIAAFGCMAFADRRHEIIHQVRGFVFGYTLTPAVGIAIFARVAYEMSSSSDIFIGTLLSALPWIWFLPVLLPVIIFGRMVAGMRAIHRLGLTDSEMLDTVTGNVTRDQGRIKKF